MLFGIDVSHHQGLVDWPAVARDGIKFGFVKATEGTGFVDRRFQHNWRSMAQVGIIRGAYHFLHPGNGTAQARHFLGAVGNAAGSLLVVDVETTASGGHPGLGDASDFVREVRRQLGPQRSIGLYTGRWYWNGILGDPRLEALRLWLWESRYVRGAGHWRTLSPKVDQGWFGQIRAGGLRPSIIQYSSSGTVSGISGRCDVNIYPNDAAALQALTGASTAQTKPKEWDEMATKKEIEEVVRAVVDERLRYLLPRALALFATGNGNAAFSPKPSSNARVTHVGVAGLSLSDQLSDHTKALVKGIGQANGVDPAAIEAALRQAIEGLPLRIALDEDEANGQPRAADPV